MMKSFFAAAAATLLASAAGASVVEFLGDPSTVFADGTFTHDLSPAFHDGFYISGNEHGAFNGFGQANESILFNAPVQLNSLTIAKCPFCFDTNSVSFTVSLYDAADKLLTSQTIAAAFGQAPLSFGANHVSRVTFTFAGGVDHVGDAQLDAWYRITDVTYGANVPEPAAWSLLIAGFGLVGGALRSRRTAVAA